jgi:hypothetical protein
MKSVKAFQPIEHGSSSSPMSGPRVLGVVGKVLVAGSTGLQSECRTFGTGGSSYPAEARLKAGNRSLGRDPAKGIVATETSKLATADS